MTFAEGEDRKRFPVEIIDDFTPEFEEYFTLHLMSDSATGGVDIGNRNKCRVVIEKSDFPYGSLGQYTAETVINGVLIRSNLLGSSFT